MLRDAFVEKGAVQCGFCTPGLMVQASHLIERHHAADEAAIRRGIEGNLCRCTGYRKIIERSQRRPRRALRWHCGRYRR
jgi:carbon-monoxide dehydrogenase small subunit